MMPSTVALGHGVQLVHDANNFKWVALEAIAPDDVIFTENPLCVASFDDPHSSLHWSLTRKLYDHDVSLYRTSGYTELDMLDIKEAMGFADPDRAERIYKLTWETAIFIQHQQLAFYPTVAFMRRSSENANVRVRNIAREMIQVVATRHIAPNEELVRISIMK